MSSPTQAQEALLARAERPDALLDGVLVVRWCVVVWLAVLLTSGLAGVPRPPLGWVALGLAGGWTLWLTLARPRWGTPSLVVDAVVCGLLLVVAAVAPAVATVYPVAAALTWGARRGLRGGAVAGALLGAVFVVAHVVVGTATSLPVDGRPDGTMLAVLGNAFSLVLAGAGVGLLSTLLQRSAAALAVAQADRLRSREQAARLAERDEVSRAVHDSALQVLAMVHKRGRELARQERVEPQQVAALAELAAEQERALRDLVLSPVGPQPTAVGALTPLRPRLEQAARRLTGDLQVEVSTVGDLDLPAPVVAGLGAAVDQALGNVLRHAGTPRAWLFAERDGEEVLLSVRDDGRGFVLDEAALVAAGRLGLLQSIRGRVEQLGGRLDVDTAPGRGTELQLRVPAPTTTPGDEHGARD